MKKSLSTIDIEKMTIKIISDTIVIHSGSIVSREKDTNNIKATISRIPDTASRKEGFCFVINKADSKYRK
jgi:hypothetical protein